MDCSFLHVFLLNPERTIIYACTEPLPSTVMVWYTRPTGSGTVLRRVVVEGSVPLWESLQELPWTWYLFTTMEPYLRHTQNLKEGIYLFFAFRSTCFNCSSVHPSSQKVIKVKDLSTSGKLYYYAMLQPK